jgi:hypothetical protein
MAKWLLSLLLCLAPFAQAGGPTHELDEKIAIQILTIEAENRKPEIKIALIQDGTSREGSFEFAHVRRVTSIETVPEGGARVRRMTCREFHWSDAYGWFTWESRKERGGEAIWIWSEIQGQVIVR